MQESGQHALPVRQFMTNEAKARYSLHTDIGHARVVHTMSGKAKVIVVREQDRKRLGRLLLLLAITVVGAASWEAWIIAEQRELENQLAATTTVADRMLVSEPAYLPEFDPTEAGNDASTRGSRTKLQVEISKLVTRSRPKRPETTEEGLVSKPAAIEQAINKSSISASASPAGATAAAVKSQALKPAPAASATAPQPAVVSPTVRSVNTSQTAPASTTSPHQAVPTATATQSASLPPATSTPVSEPHSMQLNSGIGGAPVEQPGESQSAPEQKAQ